MGRLTTFKYLTLICTLLWVIPLKISFADHVAINYWLLDEYLKQHPEQQAKSVAFERIVQGPALPLTIKQTEPVKIVVVYPGIQVSDYWRRSVASFRGRMQEIGINFELEDHFTKPGTDIQLQSRLIGEARVSAPDYLVFTQDALRHRGMIERLTAQGLTKVILQNITTPLRAFDRQPPFFYVGFDHGVGAKILANRFKAEKPQGGRFAIFYGTQGYVSQMRGGVFLHEIASQPGMELVASYYVNFDRKRSYTAALELLHNEPDLDFIYACSTDIAHGIIDALKETGRLGSVRVNGWGGGSSELSAIRAGELDFTVMRMNDDNGIAMAEAIRLDIENELSNVPAVYSGEFRLVDKNTTEADMKALEAHAFRYSN